MNRRGVALVVVLWVVAVAGTLVVTGLGTARRGIATSSYRLSGIRARWAGDACLAVGRATLEAALSDDRYSLWQDLGALSAELDTLRLDTGVGCLLKIKPADSARLDLNTASREQLLTLPGFDDEIVELLIAIRRIDNLQQLLNRLPAPKKDSVMTRYAELSSRVQFQPSKVRAVGVGIVNQKAIPAVAEDWVRSGSRIAIVGRELF